MVFDWEKERKNVFSYKIKRHTQSKEAIIYYLITYQISLKVVKSFLKIWFVQTSLDLLKGFLKNKQMNLMGESEWFRFRPKNQMYLMGWI